VISNETNGRPGIFRGFDIGIKSHPICCNDLISSRRFSKIILNARKVALPFYLKSGYVIQGDEFEEVGIPHFKMSKIVK
jgi:predicted GNAT family N-acyltransferase